MNNLKAAIERINNLLADDTDANTTYAALEARLALERVCYDRLRQSHDYISHAQLRRWQPHAIMKILINDVYEYAATTLTLSMSKDSIESGVIPRDEDFVELGTQIGFDPKYLGRLWSAISGLALHAKLPEHKDDTLPQYGDPRKIRAKISEIVVELERLSKATLLMSGMGDEVSFNCACGEKNKRRAGLLKVDQSVFCINPDCDHSFTVIKSDDGLVFETETISLNCKNCGAVNLSPRRTLQKIRNDQHLIYVCHQCSDQNIVQWRLCQVAPQEQS